MGTDKLMEEIRALGGTMDRKNWKSPKSGNDDVSKVLHEAEDFMDRDGWRLPEREAPPEPEVREQTQVGVLAEEANAFMDRSGWTLEGRWKHGMPTGAEVEDTVQVVFSTKDAATEFRKALNPQEVRGKVGVRKTKGWKTYSVVFKPHSFADRAAFLKQYKPEKSFYKDINRDLNLKEGVEESLDEGNPRATSQTLDHASGKLAGAAKLVRKGKQKYAAYEIQDALGDLARVFTEFGIEGHPLRAAKTALIKSEKHLEGIAEAANPPAPVKSSEKAYRLSVTLARKQPLRAAKYALYGAILMAKRAQNKRLMVALSKAYQIVEEEVEKEEA